MIHSHPEAVNLLKVYYLHKVTKSDRQALHNLLVWNKNYLGVILLDSLVR